MSVDLSVRIGDLCLKNPVMPASGTFADGMAKIIDFNRLGACVTKTITREQRAGNPMPRVAECAAGMLNSIGIPSQGVPAFIDKVMPHYEFCGSPLIVSISAPSVEAFAQLAEEMTRPDVAAIEANISCPNIEEDGKAFAMNARATARVTDAIRRATSLPIWMKLTPNTGELAEVAKAAEEAGADALVVSNSILAMSIDTETFRPRLGNIMGGLTGPAIKPIILRQVYQCAKAVNIPVIGCGGIASATDAIEYILAGATAVQVGTANFINPLSMIEVIEGLAEFCQRRGVPAIKDLIGQVVIDEPEQEEQTWSGCI